MGNKTEMLRYESFVKVALGMFVVAGVVAVVGIVFDVVLLTVFAGLVLAVAWVLLFAGLVAGALRPLIDVAGRDLGAQLADLAALHDAGKLTNEEYSAAKRRCIQA